MDQKTVFERNLLALSKYNVELWTLLSKAGVSGRGPGSGAGNRYSFSESRTGDPVPVRLDPAGTSKPLHSMVDPRKEAKRLMDSGQGESFLILLGLGAGYYAEAALERNDVSRVLVIEYDLIGLAELFGRIDYTGILSDPRFRLLACLEDAELNEIILAMYQPVLCGGLRVVPLRSRTSSDGELFSRAAEVISSAIEKVSADYSVQAHFGRRWFSNIIRNLQNLQDTNGNAQPLPSVKRAAITAAGPSLSLQIELLREKRSGVFLIATDTSLPCLLHAGISPDAVISIDCQHISYYHFMDGLPKEVPLFLDLASPPLLSSLSEKHRFFSCGHPLTSYVSRLSGDFPELDSSGGNVSYAAVSLAERLGAEEIELYGADYSYPKGLSYAKAAYIHSFFAKRANRLSPIEAQASTFLFRTPLEKKIKANSWYYATRTMDFYREKLEEKSRFMGADLVPVEGMGAPIGIKRNEHRASGPHGKKDTKGVINNGGTALFNAKDFLSKYRDGIKNLPKPEKNSSDYLNSLTGENRTVFTTILPLAAYFRRRNPEEDFRELFEETRNYCLKALDFPTGATLLS